MSTRNMPQLAERGMSYFIKKKDQRRSSSLGNMNGTSSATEARFVLLIGLLLSLNAGYINGLCLGGLLDENGSRRQGVSAFTGTYTKSALALSDGDVEMFGYDITMILSFIGGSLISGAINPKATPHKLTPSYGPTFLIGSIFMVGAAISAEMDPEGRTLFYFAALSMGCQNGMTSMYSANLIRTTHLTGTSTDIGLIAGQMLRGHYKNAWKFKVLVGLASAFWFGGFVSFYSASALMSHSLWISAALFLTIGFSHIMFVVATCKISFVQAMMGNWEWDRVLERMASSINSGAEGADALACLTEEQIDQVFDAIDSDGSGAIDQDELMDALAKMGMKTLTSKNITAMMNIVDENNDGVVDREEFHTLIGLATLRAKHRQEAKKKKKGVGNSLSIRWRSVRKRTSTIDSTSSDSRLPRTLEEALSNTSAGVNRAIIITEAEPPFRIVDVNEEWEHLCGYTRDEAVAEVMSNLIQGQQTDHEGLRAALSDLVGGSQHVECETINYRKDGSMFKNHLQMGPIFSDGTDDSKDEEEKCEPIYYIGVLVNRGDVTDTDGSREAGRNVSFQAQDAQ